MPPQDPEAGLDRPGKPDQTPSALDVLVANHRVIICCGPGGVGKTTMAAVLALQAARQGREACVVTVDPARRLADALGVESLDNNPSRLSGNWTGGFHAVMLDTKGTFDDLILRHARSPEQARAIQANPIYQSLTSVLSGTQEYMAMEKLYELNERPDFDTLVIDTPPSRNALDLLDAPTRLIRFLENRIFRALFMPTRAYLRALSIATHALLRTISRVAGREIVDDAVDFFRAFHGLEEGFRLRAASIRAVLADPATAYVIVTSPQPDTLEEAEYFTSRLALNDISIAAVIVNRMHPNFDTVRDLPSFDSNVPGPVIEDEALRKQLSVLRKNLDELRTAARLDQDAVSAFASRVDAPLVTVPLLDFDVHDLDSLGRLADHLFGGPIPRSVAPKRQRQPAPHTLG